MRSTLLFIFSLVFLNTAFAQRKVYNIKTLGAIADGKTDNTLIIQKAIDQAFEAGGGTVWFPAGKFVTSVIHLRSNVELHLAAGSELCASVKRITYGSGKASPLIR